MMKKRALSATSAALALTLLGTSVQSQTYVYRFKAYVSEAGPITGGTGGGADSGNGGGTDPDAGGDDTPDLTPNAFPFAEVNDATPNYPVASNAALLTGHDGVEVSLVPGREAYYQVCELADCSDKGEGDWTSDPTPDVPEGRYVRVATMAGAPGERVEVTLKAGETTSTFAATARVGDPTADFSFIPVTDASEGSPVTSNIVALPNASPADVHLLPGPSAAYQICAVGDCSDQDDSSWTQSPTANVPAGRFARIAVEAGPAPDTVTAWLKVGSSHGRFDVTSIGSGLPESFSFTDVTGVEPNVPSYSNVVQLTGDYEGFDIIPYNAGATVGGYQICPGADCSSMDGQPFETDTTYATVPGTWIRMVATPQAYGDVRPVGIQYGESVVYFTATAKAAPGDTTPNAYAFFGRVDQALSTSVTSNTVIIGGIDAPTPVSVSGDSTARISIGGGTWATSGTISAGQTLQVRLTSANTASTTRTATVNVGGVTANFAVTTRDNLGAPYKFYLPTVTNARTGRTYDARVEFAGMSGAMTLNITTNTSFPMTIWINEVLYTGSLPINMPRNGRIDIDVNSAGSNGVTRSVTLSIGGRTETWNITTGTGVESNGCVDAADGVLDGDNMCR